MQSGGEGIRLFNLRYFPLVAAFLILGIFCVKVSVAVALVLWVVAMLFLSLLLVTKHIKWGAAVLLIAVLFLGYGAASLELHFRNEVGLSGVREVTCRVVSVTEEESGDRLVKADRVRSGGKSYGGGISFETDQDLRAGDRVTLYGEVRIEMLSLESIYTALDYRNGEKYALDGPEILSAEAGRAPLNESIKAEAKAIFSRYQGERLGAFSYATLFGDSDAMEDEDRSAMREVGVAHVFAVSGLHVSVLAGVVLFLLRKLKLKEGACFLVLLPIFGFYAYLVGFTPSVLRAAIMVSLSLLARHFGMRYDDLSALGFAAILILLVRPLLLFDVSFIMSFLSLLGIHSLYKPIEEALERKKVKPAFAGALALSVASTVALIPVSAVIFGQISLVGILLNVLVVPLASLSYVLSLIGLLLTAAFHSFGALLSAARYLPYLIMGISGAVASLGLTTAYEFSTAEILVYYATLLFVGKYSLASKKVKLVAGGTGLGILAILIFAL